MLKQQSRADQLKQVARHLKLEYHPTDQWGIGQQLMELLSPTKINEFYQKGMEVYKGLIS